MKKHLCLLILLTILFFSQNIIAQEQSRAKYPEGLTPKSISGISFTENKGQVHDQNYKPRPDVLFGGTANGMAYHLRSNGISYQLSKVDSWKEEKKFKSKEKRKVPDQSTVYRVDINWLGINQNVKTITDNALPGHQNYYNEVCPNGVHQVKTFIGVTYKNIYDKIDLHYYEKYGNLKYDYIVAPNSDYKQIQLQIEGADKIELQNDGSIILKTPLGDIHEAAPFVYQKGKQLKGAWCLKKDILSFEIENYNPLLELIIDPAVRLWGTFYGNTNGGFVFGNAVDASGNIYICGHANTTSTTIATVGSHQSVFGGPGEDAYLAKFNSSGIRLWGTYYGGSGTEAGNSCACDVSGNIFITGVTTTTIGTAIATAGAHQTVFGGGINNDAFLAKFDANGVRQWGTYYGGAGDEVAYSCATDVSGNVFISGVSNTNTGNVIATVGSHQSVFGGMTDAFLIKFDGSGTRLWGTYYGSTLDEAGHGCCVDLNDNVYLSGGTNSGSAIATPGAHQVNFAGSTDCFLAKFNNNGVRQWGTYYGGPSFYQEQANSCSTDVTGNVYITGITSTTLGTSIATPGSHQSIFSGSSEYAFLAKFDPGGVRQWGTYYGGENDSYGYSCNADAYGNIFISGSTSSTVGVNIATVGSHQPNYGGGMMDGFLAQFNNSGVRQRATYYGGAINTLEIAYSCITYSNNNVYLSGETACTQCSANTIFASPGAFQTVWGWGFLAKFFHCPAPASATNTTLGGNQNICANTSTSLSANGSGTISWYSGPSSTIALGTGTSYITSVLSAGVYTFYAANTNSCSESPIRTPITITVSPLMSITTNSSSICFGQSTTLTANGANTYTWNLGANTSTIIVSPSVSTTYTVDGTTIAGCTNTSVKTITVNPLPNITVNNGGVCLGQGYLITPSGANSYTYSSGTPFVFPLVNTNYTVTGTSTAGCVSGGPVVCSITVYPKPIITASSGSVCTGNSFTILPNGAISYTYSSGSSIVSPTINTSYYVIGSSAQGCISGSVICNVTVLQLPNILVATNIALLCAGESATLTGYGVTNFTWSTGQNVPDIIVSPSVTTSYTLIGSDDNGCKKNYIFTQNVDACVGIKEINASNSGIRICPNPNSGSFIINSGTEINLNLINELGQLIKVINLNVLNNYELSIENLKNGIYFIHGTNGFQSFSKKLVVIY